MVEITRIFHQINNTEYSRLRRFLGRVVGRLGGGPTLISGSGSGGGSGLGSGGGCGLGCGRSMSRELRRCVSAFQHASPVIGDDMVLTTQQHSNSVRQKLN